MKTTVKAETVEEGIAKMPELPADVEIISGTGSVESFCRTKADYLVLLKRAVAFGY